MQNAAADALPAEMPGVRVAQSATGKMQDRPAPTAEPAVRRPPAGRSAGSQPSPSARQCAGRPRPARRRPGADPRSRAAGRAPSSGANTANATAATSRRRPGSGRDRPHSSRHDAPSPTEQPKADAEHQEPSVQAAQNRAPAGRASASPQNAAGSRGGRASAVRAPSPGIEHDPEPTRQQPVAPAPPSRRCWNMCRRLDDMISRGRRARHDALRVHRNVRGRRPCRAIEQEREANRQRPSAEPDNEQADADQHVLSPGQRPAAVARDQAARGPGIAYDCARSRPSGERETGGFLAQSRRQGLDLGRGAPSSRRRARST